MVKNFLMHPDWGTMQKFIESHFKGTTEIETIDVSRTSTSVHAEVIARQSIKNDLTSLSRSFEIAKVNYKKTKVSYD